MNDLFLERTKTQWVLKSCYQEGSEMHKNALLERGITDTKWVEKSFWQHRGNGGPLTRKENLDWPEELVWQLLRKDLSGCVFPAKSCLAHFWMQDLCLDNVCFNNTILSYTSFQGSSLQNARFVNAYMIGASFNRANVTKCNFTNAMMQAVFLKDAQCTGAIFKKAHMRYADFRNADLSGCDFQHAHLVNTIFDLASASSANFDDAIWTDMPNNRLTQNSSYERIQ